MGERGLEIRKFGYRFETCRRMFRERYGLESDLLEESAVIAAIEQIYGTYTRDADALHNLQVFDERAKNLRDFLVFVATVKRELNCIFADRRFISRDAIVFLSRRFASSFGSTAMDAIAEAANDVSQGQSRVTTFEGAGGEPIRTAVKGQIWVSDAVWSVLPEQDQPVGSNVKWVYLEAEHAFLLGKRSLIVARNANDLDRAGERLKDVSEPMLAETIVAERKDLQQDTLAQFGRDVALIANTKEDIKERALVPLQRLRQDAAHARRRSLLMGYLRFFDPSDIRVFRVIHKKFGDKDFKKRQFENVASSRSADYYLGNKAGLMFSQACSRSQKHRITIDGITYQVLRWLPNQKSYKFGLLTIASKLAVITNVSNAEIREDVNVALDEMMR